MRNRRSDGLWIVLVGLVGFAVAATTLPEPPAFMARVAAEGPAAVTVAGTRVRTAARARPAPAATHPDAAPRARPGSPV